MAQAWKTVRVFISSTFRDMQAERDHLVRFVFPRLREELLPRRIHFVDVDLRWGVTSGQDVSEVCREIIDECRPRFLCMLGGRYGWVPPGKSRSITADEVHYGVLDRTLKYRGFAYFYFRDDAATAAMVENTPGELREPQGSDNQKKLDKLKEAIIAEGLNWFTYPAQWDKDSGRLTGLKKFGDRVYDDLLGSMKSDAELRDRFVTDMAAQLDEFAEENAAMEAFVEERSERFVLGSREAVLEELLTHASATGGNGYICLTGAPGSGKSALLAHLSKHSTLNVQPSILLIRHFVGASPGSTDVRRTQRRLCYELKAVCPDITAEIPESPEKLVVAFPDFLRQACAKKRVVILLDAVNQFDPTPRSAGLHWLPEELPDNARVILSAIDSPALEELRRRPRKPPEIELKPLMEEDGNAIIEQFRKRYRKNFEPEQRAALLAKTDASMPLYLLAALEELRTLGTYEEITQRIVELPPTTHELFTWILERLENDDGFRNAAGRRVGHELVSRFAALLGASRYGLSQRELADLLAPGDAKANPPIEPDPQGNVAALLHLLRPYLMRRGELLDFYHGQLKEAIKKHYMGDETKCLKAHGNLAGYFKARWCAPDIHAIEELPWQLTQSRQWEELNRTLTDLDFLQAKCTSKLLYDLLRDFRLADICSPNDSDMRRACHRFVKEQSTLINRGEEPFLQLASNRGELVLRNLAIELLTARNKSVLNMLNRQSKVGWSGVLEGHNGQVNDVVVTPDGRYIVSASEDLTLRVWEVETGQCIRALTGHKDWVRCVATFPDGRTILSGSYDTTIRKWDILTGACLAVLVGHTDTVWDVTISPDGKEGISISHDKSMRRWDLATGRCIDTVAGHFGSIVFSPDGRLVARGRGKIIELLDSHSLQPVATLEGHTAGIPGMSFTGDGLLVSACEDRTLRVWDIERGSCLFVLRGHHMIVQNVAVAPQSHLCVSTSNDQTVRVWDLRTGKCVRTFTGHSDWVRGIAFLSDDWIVTSSGDCTLRMWHIENAVSRSNGLGGPDSPIFRQSGRYK